MKQYELNITAEVFKSDIIHYYIINGIHEICIDAYKYIKKHDSLQEAYEKCERRDWLSFLMYMTNLANVNHLLVYSNFVKEKLVESYDHNYDVSENIYDQWEEDYINYVRKEIPWELLKEVLIVYNIIRR